MNATAPSSPMARAGTFLRRLGLPFWVAALILAGSWAGWDAAVRKLNLALIKEPVPWPKAVAVDATTFRLTSFPSNVGPFALLRDNEVPNLPGEYILKDNELETLKIGTREDKNKISQRSSNWYLSRFYRDTRKDLREPYALWQLDVYYYTGSVDKIPHVAERCGVAAGATLVPNLSKGVHFPAFSAPAPWGNAKGLEFHRTVLEKTDDLQLATRQNAVFHIFSFNGTPESDWKVVRGKLATSFFTKHCYFAKIQFSPLSPVSDLAEADRKAAEFASFFMPSVAQTLPMPEDVEKLNSGK